MFEESSSFPAVAVPGSGLGGRKEMDFNPITSPSPKSFSKTKQTYKSKLWLFGQTASKRVLQSILLTPPVSLNPSLCKFWSLHGFSLRDTRRGNLVGRTPCSCDTSLTPAAKTLISLTLIFFSRKVKYLYLLIATYAAQKPPIYLTCFIKDTRCSYSKF